MYPEINIHLNTSESTSLITNTKPFVKLEWSLQPLITALCNEPVKLLLLRFIYCTIEQTVCVGMTWNPPCNNVHRHHQSWRRLSPPSVWGNTHSLWQRLLTPSPEQQVRSESTPHWRGTQFRSDLHERKQIATTARCCKCFQSWQDDVHRAQAEAFLLKV